MRRFAAPLRLADSPALRREAAQPTPDITHQKDTGHPDKFKPGLDRALIADALDGLLSTTEGNWEEKREALAELLRPGAG